MNNTATPSPPKRQLSEKILNLGFMKRNQEAAFRQELERRREKALLETRWQTKRRKIARPKHKVEYETSFLPFMTSKPSGKMIFTNEKSDISAESVQQFLAEKRAQREAIIAERRKLAEENLATKIQSDKVITIREKRRFLKPSE